MAHLSLPPNPSACLPLNDEDFTRLRQQHGTSLWSTPLKGCKTCMDQRWFAVRAKDEVVLYDCDCEEQWLLYMWLLNAGIGLTYQRLGLLDCEAVNPRAMDQVIAYLEPSRIGRNLNLGLGMMLWSEGRGTGKSLLSTIVLKKVLEMGYDGYFTTFTDMLDMYQSSWRDPEQRKWFDRKVRNVSFLVVDDIGKEGKQRSMDGKESMIDAVIRARNAAALPTIITTNWTPEEIGQGYSVLSLLSGSVEFIEVTGEDYRKSFRRQSIKDAEDGISRPVVMV
jgi:hypothetical protein